MPGHRPDIDSGSILRATGIRTRARLDTAGLPGGAADAAGDAVIAAHLIAGRAHSPALAASADRAYVHGMGVALLVCGVAALAAALLAAAFLPKDSATRRLPDAAGPVMATPGEDVRQ